MPSSRVLIVEDEQNIASLIRLYLANEGFEVAWVADGGQALAEIERLDPALVVLDVMLPGVDGFEICRRLRATSRTPVIMLTARDQEVDRIVGLELGADDYVTKPFSPRELVARVKAVLRRTAEPTPAATPGPGGRPPPEPPESLELGGVRVEPARRQVTAGGRVVELTVKEFDLLAYLIRHQGIVCSRDRLLEQVWGYDRPIDTRTVDSHIKSLRAKLGDQAAIVKTLRGIGYKAEADPGVP
ncbi:MAG TPA: response regulator transcription factor [Actinomycetota bacterium]|nr:response regulator transcription factor [Actinomycetota bacterium]